MVDYVQKYTKSNTAVDLFKFLTVLLHKPNAHETISYHCCGVVVYATSILAIKTAIL